MAIGENIDALLVKYDIPQSRLAQIAGVSESSVSRWRRGKPIRPENLKPILDYFNLTEDDILSTASGLAAKEHGTYQKPLPPGFMPIVPVDTVPIPVVDHIHAGLPTDLDEVDYTLNVPSNIIHHDGGYYGFIVDGDCMDKVYPEGCLIVIDTHREPQNGAIGAFLIDGYQSVMRRVYRGANTLILSPESFNSEHKDIVITEDSDTTVEAIGTVVWYQSREEL